MAKKKATRKKATPNKEDKPVKVEHILFLGMVRTTERKRGQLWYFLPSGYENDGSPLKFKPNREDDPNVALYTGRPLYRGAQPGLICTIDGSDAPEDRDRRVVYSATSRAIGNWQCRDQLAEWKAEHNAIGLAWDAERLSKGREDLEKLEPFRRLYRRLSGRQKEALVLNMIKYVTGKD